MKIPTEDEDEPEVVLTKEKQPENPETSTRSGLRQKRISAEITDETAVLQDLHEIENMMANLMYVLKDQNATIDALRKRFPGEVFHDTGTHHSIFIRQEIQRSSV